MIIENDLIYHWKFEALCAAISELQAYRVLHRLWGYAQARKQWIFQMDPLKLASICAVRENVDAFWEHMTGRAGWVEDKGGGWYELRGWANVNRSMINAWTTKTKRLPWMDEYEAARAKGEAPAEIPVVAAGRSADGSADASRDRLKVPAQASQDPTHRGDRSEEREEMDEIDGREEKDGVMPKPGGQEPPAVCTMEQAMAYGPMCQLSPEGAAFWWHTRNAADWYRGTAGGGPLRKVSSWQSDMATSRAWAEAGAAKQREIGKDGRPKKVLRL
jgi:hypothetical protein